MKTLQHKQCGLSLVEIMVALVISIFLLGGIVQVYLGHKTTYRFSDAMSIIQENGRFALDTITRDVRMAGFWGCTDIQGDLNGDGQLQDDNPFVQNHLNSASGNYDINLHDFINLPAVSATVNDGLNGSDSLSVRGSRSNYSNFTASLSGNGSAAIQVAANNNFQANDIILISNCWTADIFEATSVNTAAGITTITHTTSGQATTPGNMNVNGCPAAPSHCLMAGNDRPFTDNAAGNQTNNASASVLQTVTYSIQPSNSGSGEPALFRSVNGNNQELLEGIEEMQILFGVDTDADGTPNQYQASNNVADMNQVTAVRIWLVAVSESLGLLDGDQTYTLDGALITKTDRRLRQVFSSTIALRNKEN